MVLSRLADDSVRDWSSAPPLQVPVSFQESKSETDLGVGFVNGDRRAFHIAELGIENELPDLLKRLDVDAPEPRFVYFVANGAHLPSPRGIEAKVVGFTEAKLEIVEAAEAETVRVVETAAEVLQPPTV